MNTRSYVGIGLPIACNLSVAVGGTALLARPSRKRQAHPDGFRKRNSRPNAGVGTVDLMDQRPEVRIGTAERERAHTALSEYFSQGRLDMTEFETRSGQVMAARTYADLQPIFVDLPDGLAAIFPSSSGRASPLSRNPRPRVPRRTIPVGMLVLVALLLVVASHGWMLFLFFPLSGVLYQHRPPDGRGRTPGPGRSPRR